MDITLNVTLLTALMALLLTGSIFLVGFLALLLTAFNAMLKSKTQPLETRMDRIASKLDQLIPKQRA